MRPHKVKIAVYCFCMSYAVLARFSDLGNSIYNMYIQNN